jgi:hypothetical protein
MAITRLKLKQVEPSTNPGSVIGSDTSNNFSVVSSVPGSDHLFFYDDSATALVPLTVGANLSITGTTLNASAGAGGYAEVQEEGSALTARTKLNFIGSAFTAADDSGNTRTNVTAATFLNTLATAGTVTLTTDVTGDLPFSNLATLAGLSVLGRSANSTGDMAAITGTDGQILRVSGTSLGFGAITLSNSASITGTLPVANGGTGITSGTSGGILAFTASGTIASSAALTQHAIVLGGGAGAAPSTPVGLGTSTTVLHGNATGDPTWAAVSLTADVSGVLPVANGGTNIASYTIGDLIYASGATTLSKLADVATGSVLKSGGVATAPEWGTLATTDLSDFTSIAMLNENETVSGNWTFTNNVTLNGTPTVGTDIVNVNYVLDAITGLRKTSVLVATTANGTFATAFDDGSTIDGIALTTGDDILIKNQTDPAENGVYTVNASGAPTRHPIMDTAGEVTGVMVAVREGTANAGTLWLTVSNVTTLNTDPIDWIQMQTAGSVTSVAATAPAAGFTISGSPITSSGTFTFTLANDLAAVEGLSGTGIAVRVAGDTWATRTITGTTDRVTLTNGDATSANPIIDIASTYVGQTSITTLGTIATGTWNGTAIAQNHGGTGFTTYATGDILYASATNTLSKLTVGSTGQVLTVSGGVPTWSAGSSVTRAYLTGSTSSVIDLDSGTSVTDVDGGNIAFTVPTDLDTVFVVRNGVTLSRSGSVSRDYTLVSATGVLTLASALSTDESLMVYKIA